MRIEEVDKKFCSILFLAQGNEGTRIFGQKLTKVEKILQISVKEFWEHISTASVPHPGDRNITEVVSTLPDEQDV